jgi:putative restriction endonuclease
MFLALIAPGSYLEFPDPVPFIVEDGIVETGLLNEAGRISGRAQAAVRGLSAHDFRRIVSRGVDEGELLLPREARELVKPARLAVEDHRQAPFVEEQVRERLTALGSRLVRDRVSRKVVLRAYGERCGVTGLKLINGGGRAEVAAAHIRPVEHNGPDIINNGIALSGTAHWMFDRRLIGFSDNLTIMVSRQVNDRDGVASLINPTGRLVGPALERDRPHPAFLAWHREHCFKR